MKASKLLFATAVSALLVSGQAMAEGAAPAAPKKVEGHCQVTKDGKSTDIDAPADVKDQKKWCKDQGGKWEKGKKHDAHK